MGSSKAGKVSRGQWDRTTQEKIRKRRHNLFKRLTEFNERYDIDTWIIMRMPSGRIYKFATDPSEPMPSDADIQALNVPVTQKTSADYTMKDKMPLSHIPDPPSLPFINIPFLTTRESPPKLYPDNLSIAEHQSIDVDCEDACETYHAES